MNFVSLVKTLSSPKQFNETIEKPSKVPLRPKLEPLVFSKPNTDRTLSKTFTIKHNQLKSSKVIFFGRLSAKTSGQLLFSEKIDPQKTLKQLFLNKLEHNNTAPKYKNEITSIDKKRNQNYLIKKEFNHKQIFVQPLTDRSYSIQKKNVFEGTLFLPNKKIDGNNLQNSNLYNKSKNEFGSLLSTVNKNKVKLLSLVGLNQKNRVSIQTSKRKHVQTHVKLQSYDLKKFDKLQNWNDRKNSVPYLIETSIKKPKNEESIEQNNQKSPISNKNDESLNLNPFAKTSNTNFVDDKSKKREIISLSIPKSTDMSNIQVQSKLFCEKFEFKNKQSTNLVKQAFDDYYLKDLEKAISGNLSDYFAHQFVRHFTSSVFFLRNYQSQQFMTFSNQKSDRVLNILNKTKEEGQFNIYKNYFVETNQNKISNFNDVLEKPPLLLTDVLDSALSQKNKMISYEKMLNKIYTNKTKNRQSAKKSSETMDFTAFSNSSSPELMEYKNCLENKPSPFQFDSLKICLNVEKPQNMMKSIIFDLDETLIHTIRNDPIPFDFEFTMNFAKKEPKNIKVCVRPHLNELLNNLSNHFELVIFTASKSCYANPIIDKIDPCNHFKRRLFREHCNLKPGPIYMKNISVLWDKNPKDIVIVDNFVGSFADSISNGIPILSFFGNKDDDQLVKLEKFLLGLKDSADVRDVIKQHFKWNLLTDIRYNHPSFQFF